MCGIAGLIVARNGALDASVLRRLALRMGHRGPDDEGFLAWCPESAPVPTRDAAQCHGARVALVHKRLSILDTSACGWQPMTTDDGRWSVVLNGEIYNYLELRTELAAAGVTFRSHTDTEVLLQAWAAWGPATLLRLTGMFAFAILDAERRTVTLARDFFGIKPMYLARPAGGLAFASEAKVLLEVPGVSRRVNPARAYDYLRYGRIDGGGPTILADVEELPAAHYLEVALDAPDGGTLRRYWNPDASPQEIGRAEAAARLRTLFLDSVALHLRSDVPLGAALSGGIDSSAVVMAMRAVAPQSDIHTFSFIPDDARLSEERWIDLVAGAAGARTNKVSPKPQDLADDLDELLRSQDLPFWSTSMYAQRRVFQLARESGVTVVLDGQGADELLAGYPAFVAYRMASLIGRGRFAEAGRLAGAVAPARAMPAAAGRLWGSAAAIALPAALRGGIVRAFDGGRFPRWMNADWFARRGVAGYARTPRQGGRERLKDRLVEATFENSLPSLLRFEDRNSMAFSVESRVPFLTRELAEFMLSLPEQLLIGPDGTSKAVFRDAMRGLVPDAILDRRDKIGFVTPEAKWLSSLEPWVDAALAPERLARVPALDGARVRSAWASVVAGRRPLDQRVWRWITLVRWAELFDVDFAS